MEWIRNIDLRFVPKHVLQELQREALFTPEEFLELAEDINQWEGVWSWLALDEKGIAAFMWGTWCPLGRILYLDNIYVRKDLQSVDGKFMREEVVPKLKQLKEEYKARHLFVFTRRWKSVLRKLGDLVEVRDERVVEVL